MAQGPDHILTLTPPANPAGKGSDRRWTLTWFHRPVGRRIDLAGIAPTDSAAAMAAAASHLGDFAPEWIPQGPAFRAANPEEHQP
jgi:hypothetical protein